MIAYDEKAALNLLDEHDLILKKYIKDNKGTIIKHIGDAIFAEFSDSTSAAIASIQIQRELKERNKIAAGKDQISVRIGLHCGTVVAKGNDLFGNDVNLCSRIEESAIPGGIAASKTFISQIKNHSIYTRNYGSVKLKNIPKSTDLLRLYISKEDYLSEHQDDLINTLINRGIKIVQNKQDLDDYKTIAFLYPENLGSQKEDFFCHEFLNQIIDDLKKIDEIRTPSIKDVEKYKGSKKSISEISIDMSVENIAQLSILSDGDKFKVNVDLVSMSSGSAILIKSWEGKHNQLKEISAKIIAEVADKLSIKLPDIIKNFFNRKDKVDNMAFKKFLEGKYLSDVMPTSDSLKKSEKLLNQAIAIDDNFFDAYAALGMTHNLMGNIDDAEENLELAMEIAVKNNVTDSLSLIYSYMGIYYKEQKKFRKAIKNFEKGIKQQKIQQDDHMYADLLHNMSMCYSLLGEPEKMLVMVTKAQIMYDKLDDNIALGNSYGEKGNAYKTLNMYDKALHYYQMAKRIFISEEMNFKYAQVLIIETEVWLNLSKFKEAKLSLEKAIIIGQEFDNPIMNARILMLRADIESDLKNIDEAINHLETAADIFIDINNKFKVSDIQIRMGFLYLEKHDIENSKKCYLKAEKILFRLNKTNQSKSLEALKEKINSLS